MSLVNDDSSIPTFFRSCIFIHPPVAENILIVFRLSILMISLEFEIRYY